MQYMGTGSGVRVVGVVPGVLGGGYMVYRVLALPGTGTGQY